MSSLNSVHVQYTVVKRPNFFLVGAPKAGTTSLARYLEQHPDIYMSPVKEPCFFSTEVRAENFAEPAKGAGPVADWESYDALFRDAGEAKAIGEASVCYLWSASAPGNVARAIPEARILMVLRDPADRAFSQYVQGVAKGWIRCGFREHVEASLRPHDGKFRITYPLLQMGEYAGQIRRYREHFPEEQMHIRLYEDFQRDAIGLLRGVFGFLGVDTEFQPDMSRREHVYGDMKISAEDRRFLVEYYREGIRELEGTIGRDLSAWLR